MNKQRILVVGSSNTDMVVNAARIPRPGETILGGEFFMNPGGKGANQAVAAVRLGGDVAFCCKVGDDLFGREARELFRREGLETRFILTDPKNPSGVALITVDTKAENAIVVASGANAALTKVDLQTQTEAIDTATWILMQLETPLETIAYVAQKAAEGGKKVILNPAPAQELPESLYQHLYLITPNETEAELLTGIPVTDLESAQKAATVLLDRGVANVVITLGSKGALLASAQGFELVEAVRVKAIDTTAAGDVFNGALVVALAEGKTLSQAAHYAARAAAISVTRRGAQASAPYWNELL